MRVPGLLFLLMILSAAAQAQRLQPPAKDSMGFSKSVMIVPQNYYTTHLSFFCKKEVQLEKLTNVNVFFRLGSKDYVDYLERKPNARRGF
jgi:hypothetical protein